MYLFDKAASTSLQIVDVEITVGISASYIHSALVNRMSVHSWSVADR